jgi:ketosteroid isomerase-like protein
VSLRVAPGRAQTGTEKARKGGAIAETTIEQELVSLERQYWQALKDKDVEAAIALTDEPCIVVGAQGVTPIDRRTYLDMMENATWTIDDFDIHDDVQVRVIDEKTAIVAYTVHEELTVDGEPVSFDAADTSMWVRRDGRWLCALHTESLAGDPFGRDRQSSG